MGKDRGRLIRSSVEMAYGLFLWVKCRNAIVLFYCIKIGRMVLEEGPQNRQKGYANVQNKGYTGLEKGQSLTHMQYI